MYNKHGVYCHAYLFGREIRMWNIYEDIKMVDCSYFDNTGSNYDPHHAFHFLVLAQHEVQSKTYHECKYCGQLNHLDHLHCEYCGGRLV